ncbi:MAG: zinc ribbon domain-containing protein [Methanomassiliicoccaceae archaeon]|jgi:hypothetical protein|nr:zinc ribbon domain-containing protein [Methanomassiliicoccaceae archaeon]
MLQAFTKNYNDNSTEAGFQFTFNCDACGDGYKSSFIESETFKKKKASKLFGGLARIGGSLVGGRTATAANAASDTTSIYSERFEGMTPEWHKEHENAFVKAQNESKKHFHKCPGDNNYVCDQCWNEDAGLCTGCAPRQEVYVAKAAAGAMKRNIDEKAATAVVWDGKIESKTTICPQCGKQAGTGKFCNNCGANMEQASCPKCGAKNSPNVRFCNNCGLDLKAAPPAPPAPPSGKCSACGFQNDPGTKFCGGCGGRV